MIAQMWIKDYDQIHISDICREVGISRAVFYRYFETKFDVLDAWLDRRFSSYNSNPVVETTPRAGTHNFIHFWYENRDMPELLIRQNMFDLLIQKGIRAGTNMPFINQILGMEDNSAEVHRSLVFSAYGIMGILRDWQVRGFKESEEEMVEVINSILLKPLYCPENLQNNMP